MNSQTCFFLIQTRAQLQRLKFARETAARTGAAEYQPMEEMPKQVRFSTLCVPDQGDELDCFADSRRIRLRVKGRRWQFSESQAPEEEAVIFLDTEIIADEATTGAGDNIWAR